MSHEREGFVDREGIKGQARRMVLALNPEPARRNLGSAKARKVMFMRTR
jgi:hypothetical protein